MRSFSLNARGFFLRAFSQQAKRIESLANNLAVQGLIAANPTAF
jgi:hypothetical protein